jgi:hypothetical protein
MNRFVVLLACLALAGVATGQTWENGPQSPFAYTRFDGEYFPATAKVYFLGGRIGNSTTLGDIYSYTPLTGEYADVGVDMPLAVSNYDVCLLRDDHDLANGDTFGLYIVGGRYDGDNYSDSVQVYYPISNTAEMLTTDAFPGRSGDSITVAQSAIVYDNIMYVMGGFSQTGNATTAEVWCFDPLATAGSRWSQLADMPLARAYPIVATVDSFLFACGGDSWVPQGSLYAKDQVFWLNLNDTAGGWTTVAPMPGINGESRGFGFDTDSPGDFAGEIIIAGRGVWSSESAHCYIYNVASDSWDSFPSLAQRRRNHAGVYIPAEAGGTGVPGIWVFGGRQDLDTLCLQVSEYYVTSPTGVAQGRGSCVARELTVVPNPSRGQVTIRQVAEAGGVATFKVYDVLGKEVWSGRSQRGSLVVSGLAAGTYIVRTEEGGEETKFVVAR